MIVRSWEARGVAGLCVEGGESWKVQGYSTEFFLKINVAEQPPKINAHFSRKGRTLLLSKTLRVHRGVA